MPRDQGSTVGELGESGVLQRVLAQLRPAMAATLGPGDDCAVMRLQGELVVTSDTMVEGPDFRRAWHSGFELGWKLAATNLSDVAAMGARPIGLTVSLAVPRDTPVTLLEDIAAGLTAACEAMAPGCGVVGGDLGTAPVITAAVTALGDMEGHSPVTRSGAQPGDQLAYAGDLGLAGLGLSLLFAHAIEEDGSAHGRSLAALWERHPEVLAAQLAPTPPIPLGVIAGGSATAMMDVSDSLSVDAERLAQASGVAIRLDSRLLADAFGMQEAVSVPIAAMLAGGEDHGLLATFPDGATLPEGFHPIGYVIEQAVGDVLLHLDEQPYESRGWDPYTIQLPGLVAG
ncbi:thiamine-phosphate kinase [Leucobacter coleopterorum]|uniref:Thiamine-monophosphate kinase n=1 Tax=Leucobacter coleopterorum TaxID=2714933 RepID=A0ABX6K0Q1_9MICO|nr:thiamine-phosphate kinase [Leucobacter coleopterorum]QIM18620.1 thiamine-phosphate kinase [Leucobacter coleopterorum]